MLQLDKLQRMFDTPVTTVHSRIASFSGFSTALRSFSIPRCPLQGSCWMFSTITPAAFFANSADAFATLRLRVSEGRAF